MLPSMAEQNNERRFSSRPPSYRTAQRTKSQTELIQNHDRKEEQEPAIPRPFPEERPPKELTSFQLAQNICELLISIVLDFLLLIFEVGANIKLALELQHVGSIGAFRAIIIFTTIPSILLSLTWMSLCKQRVNQHFGYCWILLILLIGYPSPVLVYLAIWITIFKKDGSTAENAKVLGNQFRVVQACFSSNPILLINLSVLFSVLENENKLDFARFADHPVSLHTLAAFLSLLNIIRAASLFNDRKSFTITFIFIGLPFIVATTLTRTLSLSLMLAFFPQVWSIATILAMFACNMLLYRVCIRFPGRSTTVQENPYPLTQDALETDQSENSYWSQFPNHVLYSLFSIICPLAYSNDEKHSNVKMRGGCLIVFNYIMNMSIIGIALGFTIHQNVPNEIHGIRFHQPNQTVVISGTKVQIPLSGIALNLNLPDQEINLASMPDPYLNLNTEQSHIYIASAFPILMVFMSLPWMVMRAAIMELDCLVVRRKFIDGEKAGSTSDIVHENAHGFRMRIRIYSMLCCSVFATFLFTFSILGGGGMLLGQLHG
ncbi:hypothetical protein TCAL_10801 [Tigriopus californicus]|uniref:Uncharacterized protein n=1 Tax=Tigriopus californicus TaxID=6832 RepID=A0A553PBM8_TIGCA|nr:uncharacterized protein LOC131891657 [Tigriopus californicus]TRY75084.1 hypothetical protein TCAL_10801 [Tigriopus californicus]|eukprot:TCALIF_10801-PA protein Name:"Protein of unknown function" AED:0.00 eAED:0.00 QI:84/1/1/1/0.5/0.6/5/32/546